MSRLFDASLRLALFSAVMPPRPASEEVGIVSKTPRGLRRTVRSFPTAASASLNRLGPAHFLKLDRETQMVKIRPAGNSVNRAPRHRRPAPLAYCVTASNQRPNPPLMCNDCA
ncbi:unnamed protein product, partial [Iphiclides podalirius]